MFKRPSSLAYASLSVIAGACMATSALLSPVFAAGWHSPAGAHTGAGAHASSPGGTFKQQTCKKKPTASGTLKWSDWQFPDTLNVYQTGASVSEETIVQFEDPGLVTFDQAGKPHPDLLAALPTHDKTGKTWYATLKKGLRWSNGQEITAADVKFGFQIGTSSASGPWCKGTCDVISRVDTKGKYGLVFHLSQVYAPFVDNALFNLPVWPTSWPNAWTKGDVATATKKLFQDQTFNFENNTFPTDGAYQVSQFVQNDRIVLTPMKYYHTLSCGARVAQMIFVFYSSKPSMIAAAAAGQTDMTTDYTPGDLKQLLSQQGPHLHVNNPPGFLYEHLELNQDPTYNGQKNPLHDRRVRLALALALDKYGLIESALGISRQQASQIISWSPWIITPSLTQAFADKKLVGQWDPIAKKYIVNTGTGRALKDAQTLLTQAGYPGGHFTLDAQTTSGNPIRQAQFSVIQANWARIGVQFNPTYVPASKFFSDWDHGSPLQHGQFQVAQFTSVGYPDPDLLKESFDSHFIDRDPSVTVHSNLNGNVSGIRDTVIDNAFVKAATTLSKSVRQKYYNIIQTRLNQNADIICLYYRGSTDTDDGKIGNFAPNPTNLSELWNSYNFFIKGNS